MKTVTTVGELRQLISHWRQQGLTIGFVPTMGNLHQGHLNLVEHAQQHADKVVASIFVNPMQFGKNEDIDSYPRTFADDQAKLTALKTDILFAPDSAEIYPQGSDQTTYIDVPGVSDGHCGASRPGHFRGVATVVCKLFNMVQPDVACFGLKDYQQVQVIQAMVRDLNMPVKIVEVPTVREPSGLAMSSRNGYLSAAEKRQAPLLYQTLSQLAEHIKHGADADNAVNVATEHLNDNGFKVDYIHVCHAHTLAKALLADKSLVILVAAYLGKARLIDNIQCQR